MNGRTLAAWSLAAGACLLLIAGCQGSTRTAAILTSPQALPVQTEPANHCVYVDSDETYHYFRHRSLAGTVWYKVPLAELPDPQERHAFWQGLQTERK